MQTLANKFLVNVIHIFSITEHGKGEVDHAGGLATTTLQRAIAAGEFFKVGLSPSKKFFHYLLQ